MYMYLIEMVCLCVYVSVCLYGGNLYVCMHIYDRDMCLYEIELYTYICIYILCIHI